jgi:hypothetical protein
LARSSSSLPPIVRQLLSYADQRLGEGVSEEFVQAFDRVDRENFFEIPMLHRNGTWVRRHLSELQPCRTRALQIENPTDSDVELSLSVKIDAGSVEDLFGQFIRATSHSNPVGDFRSFPDQFAPILLGPRYFMFHGDGHCFLLANLFAALLGRFTEAEFLVRYVVTESRSFMHAFIDLPSNGGRLIVDPDQKAMVSWDDALHPSAMMFQLLCLGGAGAFAEVGESDRGWLFSRSTQEVFAGFGANIAQPRIYREGPHPAEIRDLFSDARVDHMEAVSLQADDYAWKSRFRTAMSGKSMLSNLDRRVNFTLPPGSTLSLGLEVDDLPREAELFPLMFFGRVPAVFRATIPPCGRLVLAVPERPWLCCVSKSLEKISINGRELMTHRSGDFSILGAGDLDDIVVEPGIDGNADFVVDGPPGETVRVVLPFNALAFNSNIIGFAGDLWASASERANP